MITYVEINTKIHGLDIDDPDTIKQLQKAITLATRELLLGDDSLKYKFRDEYDSDIEVDIYTVAGSVPEPPKTKFVRLTNKMLADVEYAVRGHLELSKMDYNINSTLDLMGASEQEAINIFAELDATLKFHLPFANKLESSPRDILVYLKNNHPYVEVPDGF